MGIYFYKRVNQQEECYESEFRMDFIAIKTKLKTIRNDFFIEITLLKYTNLFQPYY